MIIKHFFYKVFKTVRAKLEHLMDFSEEENEVVARGKELLDKSSCLVG